MSVLNVPVTLVLSNSTRRAGVELVEVSTLLGHSELRVTADLYTHLVQQTAAKAARRMDALLGVRNG